MAQLMAHFLAHRQQQTQQPPTGEITEKPEDVYGMSTTYLDIMLIMCGLPSGAYDSLPSWLKKVNKKHQTDNTKNKIILKQIKLNMSYEDVEMEVM
eukprot:5160820-Ditylum_brightwellii.AAC.1